MPVNWAAESRKPRIGMSDSATTRRVIIMGMYAFILHAADSLAQEPRDQRGDFGNSPPVSRDRRLMQTEPTCFIEAYVSESTKVRNMPNTLTFNLSPSCELLEKSSIVISGIPSSISSTKIPVQGTLTTFIGSKTATITRGPDGINVAVTLDSTVPVESTCGRTLAFTISNPSGAQEMSKNIIEISVQHPDQSLVESLWGRYTVKSDATLVQPASILRGELSNTFVTRLPPTFPSLRCPSHIRGSLVWIAQIYLNSICLRRGIQESSAVSGELNVLTFQLQPDFPLSVGTLIRIDGLSGSLTPSNYWYNTSASVATQEGCSAAAADLEWEPAAGLCRILNPNGACINVQAEPSPHCRYIHLGISSALTHPHSIATPHCSACCGAVAFTR